MIEYDKKKAIFRKKVAGLIRTLIQARLTHEPDFISLDLLERWKAGAPRPQSDCIELLTHTRDYRTTLYYRHLTQRLTLTQKKRSHLTD